MPLEELSLQKLATHVREGGNEGVAPPPWVPFSEVREFSIDVYTFVLLDQ